MMLMFGISELLTQAKVLCSLVEERDKNYFGALNLKLLPSSQKAYLIYSRTPIFEQLETGPDSDMWKFG